jgi:Exonuclease
VVILNLIRALMGITNVDSTFPANALVAHNAGFDIAFLNAELKRAGKSPIATERVVDTLVLAWRKHSGEHNTLDDLCSRYGINSLRSKHGALLDAELLAAVYVELITTRQAALALEPIARTPSNVQALVRARARPLPPRVTAAYFFLPSRAAGGAELTASSGAGRLAPRYSVSRHTGCGTRRHGQFVCHSFTPLKSVADLPGHNTPTLSVDNHIFLQCSTLG